MKRKYEIERRHVMTRTKVEIVTEAIKELGIPANLLGYHYARYAVLLLINDESFMNNICAKLYPEIANRFKTTSSRVERTIRHAIEIGWDRGNIDFQKNFRRNVLFSCDPFTTLQLFQRID